MATPDSSPPLNVLVQIIVFIYNRQEYDYMLRTGNSMVYMTIYYIDNNILYILIINLYRNIIVNCTNCTFKS